MYFVNEIQDNVETPYAYDDKATAFEKFFDIARYIPKSNLNVHTVTITNENGVNVFTPITKESLS